MVHIVWKKIRGHGPYAYLYRSFRDSDGRVRTSFVKYLGKIPPGTKLATCESRKTHECQENTEKAERTTQTKDTGTQTQDVYAANEPKM